MRYTLYCITVFTLAFGTVAIYYGAGRHNYRKRFNK